MRTSTVLLVLASLLPPVATATSALDNAKPLPRPVQMRFCLFDPMGANGDITQRARDLALEAQKWNLFVQVKSYTDERVAAEEFKAGQCEGVAMTTLRAKQFNRMVGSIDSPGNLPDYEHVKTLLKTLSNPVLASLGINGRYQVVGVAPIGSIFVVVNDRSINSIEKAAGKKVVVLDWDPSMGRMISSIGAQPVPADLTTYAGKFNNGQADIIAAPAMAYQPMELYKGIGKKGGIIRFPLLQATGTVLIRRDLLLPRIPDLDTRLAQVREYGLQHIDTLIDVLKKSEADLPRHLWVDLSAEDRRKYARMLREARIYMTREGVYDPTMMNILKRVRCKHDPANEECGTFDE
ncbi:MAG TPA: putative solute-binding protein [Moraxellaceae bacterium]|nr:putative solute-binding protein [Moraxellaceae bacterium]